MSPWAVLLAFAAASAAFGGKAPEERACMLPPEFETLWPSPEEVTFHPTTLEERAAFERLVPALLEAAHKRGAAPSELVALAARVGFILETWRAGEEVFWALREKRSALRGAGAYVLRTGPALEVAVQAPHAYFDIGTGALAAELFACAPEGRRPRALLTNSAHRFRGRPGERQQDPDHPADVAHNPEHLFQIVTDSLARAIPSLRVFQIHGFGARESRGKDLTAVVSTGTRSPPPWARAVTTRLGHVLGDGVRLYPDDTELLGGMRNAQARLLQSHGRTRFVHLELSPAVRRALKTSERIAALADALFHPEED